MNTAARPDPALPESSSASPLVELRHVRLVLYGAAGPVEVLRDVSLTAGRGETVAILGPSGAGKSSILAVIGGLEQIQAGTVMIDGVLTSTFSEDQLAAFRRGRTGIVFQSFHLLGAMTALENVSIPMEIAGIPDARNRALRKLEEFGLGNRAGHYPSQLSGGEQQRVAIARALVSGPRLLLADEPTGNLDQETGRLVTGLLLGARDTYGTTVIIVTHDMGLAGQCDRIIRISDGRITSRNDTPASGETVA